MGCKKTILFIIVLFVISVILITANVNAQIITGEAINEEGITGKAISQAVNINISILVPNPMIWILSPKNQTYFTNRILLNFSKNNYARTIWYNIDGSDNTTITSSLYLTLASGSHKLYLYANNSDGDKINKSITFVSNASFFNISYTKCNNIGSTTIFEDYSYDELQNLSNVTFEGSGGYGKILFMQAINVTGNTQNGVLDLDSHMNLSYNRIELNSTALSSFNVTATLWLTNLTFTNPRILKDGAICPSDICTEENYSSSSGTLIFNVTGFSVYSAEETPTGGGGTTGGGGATTEEAKLEFEVMPKIINVMIKKGETFKSSIKVKNIASSKKEFNLKTIALEKFIIISEEEFSLNPHEEKEISLIFSAPDNIKEDMYVGKIKISSDEGSEEIPVVLNIKSKVVLFDITLNIPVKYKEILPGEEVLAQVSIYNLGNIGKVDVEVTYYIKDFEGNTLLEQKEIISVEAQVSFSKSMKLPKNTAEDQYIIGASIKYGSSIGTASDIFYMRKSEPLIKKFSLIIIISLALAITLITVFLIYYFKRKIKVMSRNYVKELNKIESRISEGHLKVAEVVKIGERLKLQLALLNKAYERGYITKQSYEIGRLRIKKVYAGIKEKYL